MENKTIDDMRIMSSKILEEFRDDGFSPSETLFVISMTLAIACKGMGLSMAQALDRYVLALKEVYDDSKETKQ